MNLLYFTKFAGRHAPRTTVNSLAQNRGRDDPRRPRVCPKSCMFFIGQDGATLSCGGWVGLWRAV